MRQKEQQIQEWEHEFHQKEMEFLTKEEFIKEQYNKNLLETRTDLENQYSASMQQLRTDLDEDYHEQLRRLEASLNDHYGAEIGQLNSRHQEQVLWWNVLSVLCHIQCANLNRVIAEKGPKAFVICPYFSSVYVFLSLWNFATLVS